MVDFVILYQIAFGSMPSPDLLLFPIYFEQTRFKYGCTKFASKKETERDLQIIGVKLSRNTYHIFLEFKHFTSRAIRSWANKFPLKKYNVKGNLKALS